jgi:hypothetical protein
MAYYAELDDDNVVVNLIVADPDDVDELGLKVVRTYPNAGGRQQYRYNHAQIGGTYDADADAFIEKQIHETFVLDANKQWIPPVPAPTPDWWNAMSPFEKENATDEQKSSVNYCYYNIQTSEWVDTGRTVLEDEALLSQ